MSSTLIHDHLHNPFHNRFNVPVTCRRAEGQAYAYKAWLRERNQDNSKTQSNSTAAHSLPMVAKQKAGNSEALELTHWAQLFAAVFTLLLVLLASAAALKAF